MLLGVDTAETEVAAAERWAALPDAPAALVAEVARYRGTIRELLAQARASGIECESDEEVVLPEHGGEEDAEGDDDAAAAGPDNDGGGELYTTRMTHTLFSTTPPSLTPSSLSFPGF